MDLVPLSKTSLSFCSSSQHAEVFNFLNSENLAEGGIILELFEMIVEAPKLYPGGKVNLKFDNNLPLYGTFVCTR
jgi:hypothetical protein